MSALLHTEKAQSRGKALNYIFFIPLFLLAIIIINSEGERKRLIARRIINKRKKLMGENKRMEELLQEYLEKECIVYTVNGQITGVIKKVGGGAVRIAEESGNSQLINVDYIVRVREYPKNKNGKRKALVLD